MVNLLQGPIPGQSLTDTPRNAPWERPAEIDTVEGAVKYYVNKLADTEVMDDLAVTFELGADLRTLTETIVMMGSMKGLHTVETGMLAGPVVASFIQIAMKELGVDVPETPVSFEEEATAREKARIQRLTDAAVEQALKGGADASDPGVAFLQELSGGDAEAMPEEDMAAPAEEETQMEEMPAPEMGAGLMSRGGTA